MKNIKSGPDCESPKTPGGISKSLLTPCRRIGLSKKWKNKGSSPFVSPLSSSSNIESSIEKPTRKRKSENEHESSINQTETLTEKNAENNTSRPNIAHTPSRSVNLHRKRSKILECNTEGNDEIIVKDTNENKNDKGASKEINHKVCESGKSKVLKLTRTKSYKLTKAISPAKSNAENLCKNHCAKEESIKITTNSEKNSERSPNNLSKECFVLIQKNLFQNDENKHEEATNDIIERTMINKESQVLFDSDLDDLPLNKLNTIKDMQLNKEEINKVIFGDHDFVTKNVQDHKLAIKKPPKDLKNKEIKCKVKHKEKLKLPIKQLNDDDDDFEMDTKRTILFKKTYEKVTKPQKAKSTGSITQKDIDELRMRIEEKKKFLLAKTLTNDTKELRDLIKKWQRGCQDALMELMDLMKEKCDKKMDYSDILQMLKIPSSLVGYDSDNECFVTPDDTNIVLAKLND